MKKITLMLFALLVTCYAWQINAQVTVTGNNNTVVAIPDNSPAGITSSVNIAGIPAGATLNNVEIDLAMTHTWAGDLNINLTGPGGESIILVTRPGAAGAGAGDSSDLLAANPITFSDAATVIAENMGNTITGAQVICRDDGICNFKPNSGVAPDTFAAMAAAINGGSTTLNGNWVVSVSDNAGGDTGSFAIPQLRVTYTTAGPPPPPPPISFCGAGTPKPIPNTGTGGAPCAGGPTTSAATVATVGTIGSADGQYTIENVTINITHTWDSDLDITLVSPNGITWDLSSDNGGSGDNYFELNKGL
jgi:subtilisin-like proprotein convertase family protein